MSNFRTAANKNGGKVIRAAASKHDGEDLADPERDEYEGEYMSDSGSDNDGDNEQIVPGDAT